MKIADVQAKQGAKDASLALGKSRDAPAVSSSGSESEGFQVVAQKESSPNSHLSKNALQAPCP